MRAVRHVRPAGPRRAAGKRQAADAGYALLMALFIGALMIIAAAVAIPNLVTEDRRQKEALMIWRGRQYARAIGLFYRKTGRFPHDLEELEKGVGDVHFLRKAYKDPMNGEDGSWRLIYLGPGGQLIGSLCWQTMAEYQAAVMGMSPQGMGIPGGPGVAAPAGAAFGGAASGATSGDGASAGVIPAAPTCGAPPNAAARQTGSAQQLGAFANPQGAGASTIMQQSSTFSSSQPKAQVIAEGQMVGGNLVGVASKVKQKSLKTYLGGKTYQQWEFIWNPLQGQANGAASPATTPANGQQPPASPNAPLPFGAPQPPGAAIPPGPGSSPSTPPSSPEPG